MKVYRRTSLCAALSAAPLLLCLVGPQAACYAEPAFDATAQLTAAQQFYTQVLGHWVGTMVYRVNGKEPVTGYFHLIITRVDANTFREEYIFYRVHPKTAGTREAGGLETSGTEIDLSVIDSSGVIRRTTQGSGTVLIDFKPKNQSFEASGAVHFTGPDHLEAVVKGKIAVEGLPLGAGKHGKLRKATATLSLEGDKLIGQTGFEASFRVLFFTRGYRVESLFRGQRGDNVEAVAGGAPAP